MCSIRFGVTQSTVQSIVDDTALKATNRLQQPRHKNKVLHLRDFSGSKDPQTAIIPSPHSLAAILSPSAPPESDSAVGVSRSSSPKRSHAEAFSATDSAYLHPASPKQHKSNIIRASASSPGALGASGGVDDGGGGGGGQEEKKPAKMVRSSIACARCRRSKVKCVNNGVSSVCRACESSSRECTYPSAATPTPKRLEPPMGIKIEGEGDTKKRIRKHDDSGRRNSSRVGEEPLDSPILTRKVWDEVYDIFKLNFSTEMPFLHPPTFRARMRQASHPRDPSVATNTEYQEGKVLLLAVLTLTARFHPELTAYHSPATSTQPNNPLVASDYYANALASTIFGPSGRDLSLTSVERIQALLMLGLYEWGQTRGLSAWVYVGIATRLAQAMALPYEDDSKARTFKSEAVVTAGPLRPEVNKSPARENAIEKEVRRRTFWSCFIMDRMLSAGKARPTMIESATLHLQLPCSDDQFLFTQAVQTGYLNRDFEKISLQSGNNSQIYDNGVLSKYCRLVEIWGKLTKWSLLGGRRVEEFPPWDERTKFHELSKELDEFTAALPENLTFTEANLSAHLEKRNATTYASLHTLHSLCRIVLHREYIPFIPLRCTKPEGPLDEPVFPKDKYDIPEGWWGESANTLFSAAREIVDIMRTCQDNNALPESPLFVFALFHAAFTGAYSIAFPLMDKGNHMGEDDSKLPLTILREMIPRLTMAKGYWKQIESMTRYYFRIRQEYSQYGKDVSWKRGGLDEFKGFEKDLKEFGTLEDNNGSDGSDPYDRSRASTSDIGPGSSINGGEPMQGVDSRSQTWAAINSNTTMDAQHSQYPQNGTYQPSPGQNSNPPSLISPSTGDTASSINSPYSNAQGQNHSQLQQMQPHYGPPMVHNPQNMAPPGTQAGWSRDPPEFDHWIGYLEGISMNTNDMNNFNQSMEGPGSMPQFGHLAQATWTDAVQFDNPNPMVWANGG